MLRVIVATRRRHEWRRRRSVVSGVDGTMQARKIVMSDAAFFFRPCVALPRDPDFSSTRNISRGAIHFHLNE